MYLFDGWAALAVSSIQFAGRITPFTPLPLYLNRHLPA